MTIEQYIKDNIEHMEGLSNQIRKTFEDNTHIFADLLIGQKLSKELDSMIKELSNMIPKEGGWYVDEEMNWVIYVDSIVQGDQVFGDYFNCETNEFFNGQHICHINDLTRSATNKEIGKAVRNHYH